MARDGGDQVVATRRFGRYLASQSAIRTQSSFDDAASKAREDNEVHRHQTLGVPAVTPSSVSNMESAPP